MKYDEVKVISDSPVLGFFWSPDSTKLAYLTPTADPEIGPRASTAPYVAPSHLGLWLRWHVWDGETSYELARFSPADTFLVECLRSFDQYARSMTLWAPDGAAFTFPGLADDGTLGVWVQQAAPGGELQRAGDGVFAAWSPR